MPRFLVQAIDRNHGKDIIKKIEVEARKPVIAAMVAINTYKFEGDRLALVVTPLKKEAR